MARTHTARRGRGGRPRAAAAAAACLAALALAACDNLLTVTSPSRLADASFLVPQNAALIAGSAQADFECAFSGYTVAAGLAGGELAEGSSTAARWSYDRRDVLSGDATYATAGCTALGVYTPISTARFTNDQALARLDGWTDAQVPNRAALQLNAAVYAGFSYVLLAEGFCSAAVNLGPELTTANLLDSAEARFTRAIALAPAVAGTAAAAARRDTLLTAAYAGRARARLGLGNAAGAAQDAQRVPLAFVLNTTNDNNSARRQNRVFAENNTAFTVTVAPAYRSLGDPRVRATDAGRNASDGQTRLWTQGKYASLTAPTPIATGVEAQLILAEAQGPGAGLATLNALRARAGVGLPALTAATAADFTAAVYEERRRELFLQGNRWFDLRRGNLALTPAPGTVYAKGGTYGTQRCWPIPDVEKAANPNI